VTSRPDSAAPFDPAYRETRSDWVRLRTLGALRWLAIAGQLGAILVADRIIGVALDLGLCLLVVGASAIVNLVTTAIYPRNKRLSESEALVVLLFDLSQLAALLYLTGGINNPFALLILAPVTISATALQPRSTLFLGAVAVALTTLLTAVYVPLRLDNGDVLRLPGVFSTGFWLSIVIGIAFLGVYAQRVASEIHTMGDALLATQMALAREQKLTDLGGVVAAAAHELGTPLATIKLVSGEMLNDLSDRPTLREDSELIRDQADRCRDILRSMGRAGKDDMLLRNAPLEAVIREAAEPHVERGRDVRFRLSPPFGLGQAAQPTILRRPEIIHGLRNLVQNAVDFARSTVWIDIGWTDRAITIRIIDDGPGFPPQVLGRIGDPFVRQRSEPGAARQRPGYEGMGLGLFIAKTLLERSGAEISFANGADPFLLEVEQPARTGAIVEVIWPRDRIGADPGAPMGANPAF
jgi:two-component system sensor histidine kinase RegB